MDYFREICTIKTNRYKKNGYNLDLSYITDNIIAMGLPAQSFRKIYKNPINQVSKLIMSKHKKNFLVVNCGAYKYEENYFNDQVYKIKWRDHYPCEVLIFFKSLLDVRERMISEKIETLIVHCFAGKGRTGSFIQSYLVLCGFMDNIKQANEYYLTKRGVNVTKASQLRYMGYFQQFFENQDKDLNFYDLKVTKFCIKSSNSNCFFLDYKFKDFSNNNVLYRLSRKKNKFTETKSQDQNEIVFELNDFLLVNVRDVYLKGINSRKQFRVNFNLFFVKDNQIKFSRSDLEGKGKMITEDFEITIFFEPLYKDLEKDHQKQWKLAMQSYKQRLLDLKEKNKQRKSKRIVNSFNQQINNNLYYKQILMLKQLQRTLQKKTIRNFCIQNLQKQEYQFFDKTLAFSVNNPHFPHNAVELNVPFALKTYIDEYLTQVKFATVLFPRKETTSVQSLRGFYDVGQYCTLEKLSENTIGLQSIHRVQVKDLIVDKILQDKQEIFEQMQKGLNLDFKQTIIEEQYDEDDDEKILNKSNFYLKLEDHIIDNVMYSKQEVFPLLNFDELTLEDRVKVDNLIQYTKNLDPRFNINRSFLVNYNDIEQFLDEIAYQAWKTGIFNASDIIPLYAESDFSKKINISIQFIKKLSLVSNQLKQIVEEAERNIQRKKQYEVQNEIVKILKNQAQQDEISQIDRIKQDFQSRDAPENVRVVFDENMQRLSELDRNHPEYNVIMNYLKWIACLPYGKFAEENFDLKKARKILDEDHEGLEDVKKRILEFLAVGKLKKSVKGKILCLKGPPGVGKTSFAFSIGRVLNKKVFRISLGGESDVSVLKGHRKTYIGSRPGKIIDALKQTQQENCVLIIDEIDKTAQANAFGDPQSTLLEILDPEQNNQFMDNFLDFPVDLSNVFFICTANNLSTIQQPLLDRMDIIEIHSYTNKEKREIFEKHLLPKAIENTGLIKYCNCFEINPEIVETMINGYCRESGIRSLQKNTNKLLEKIAYKILEQTEEIETSEKKVDIEKIVITNDNLEEYLGNKIFEDEKIYETLEPGVVQGLAYSGHGGALLYIESSLSSKKQKTHGLKLTGNLGDVMKESMKIAYSFTRKFLKQKGNNFLGQNQIHIHVPEGATPKDGPSAGIALTSSLISLAMNKPINKDIAMTGEISLKGKVMKIGGLKEKLIAANREGITEVILPQENKEVAEDLSEDIKKNLKFNFVENYKEVYKILFTNQFKA